MEKDILDGQIGSVGSYDLEFKGGKLQFTLGVNPGALSADVKVAVDAGKVIDAIAKAIPGQVDDALLGMLKSLLAA